MIGTDHLYKRYQAFISSTLLDLRNERKELRKALSKNNYIVEGMELFPAANKRQWQVIKERIDKSDIYVLVIGDRYGSLAENAMELEPKIVETGEVISFTHLEFRYAKNCGLPILVFIKSNRNTVTEVDRFIKEVQDSNITTAYWEDSIDLVTEVLAGLSNAISEPGFASANGWVKVNSLNKPIDSGDKSIFLESKIHYVKFVSYSDRRKSENPLYKKYIIRLNKELDVWDEYVTLTINQLSHYLDNFQYYVRTDGDAVDFSTLLPFVSKLTFSDVNEGAKDTVFNPLIDQPSNTYVNSCSFINGFQDNNTDIAVKATHFSKVLRLFVDFTSIPNFESIFEFCKCVEVQNDQTEIDISSEYKLIQKGVYMIEKYNVQKNSVLKFKFKLV